MIDPSASDDEIPETDVLLLGRVIVISLPALATGSIFGTALTFTVTWSSAEAPSLSVTFNLNTYVP